MWQILTLLFWDYTMQKCKFAVIEYLWINRIIVNETFLIWKILGYNIITKQITYKPIIRLWQTNLYLQLALVDV